MMTEDELKRIARTSGLNLYQQEKDYLLKTFLHAYYKRFENAIFKGGTCIRYLYGADRFSEDLDFNLKIPPKKFKEEVEKTLNGIGFLGIRTEFKREELFEDAYACEINFSGSLALRKERVVNKFRIDAGKRSGIINQPRWEMISSEYPETPQNFMILAMEEKELLAEKIIALIERNKGRDLYDTWFMLKKGVNVDSTLIQKKAKDKQIMTKIKKDNLPTKQEYERDMKRLATRIIPYDQIIKEIKDAL